jgi:NAD(P)-dependent dehydrogenase (short-subunit alcohol dehydrogenase family)/pimeloyl-ACP methyl ester carboxylesterase/aryl carrier-like protein
VHVSVVDVDWAAVFDRSPARRVELPGYAFQRRRYWLDGSVGVGDVAAAGLVAAGHPLLGAVVQQPDSGGVVLTGRLAANAQPWLADHAALGTVLLPGTGFVELAIRAGDEVGCNTLRELVLEAPLILPDRGGVQLQVVVGSPGETAERGVSIYSRLEAGGDRPWVLHAVGVLSSGEEPVGRSFDFTQWPPAGAEVVDVTGAYERLAQLGYEYGPAFQGLQRAWRRSTEAFAEVRLPEQGLRDVKKFGLHPALFDASVHIALLLHDFLDGQPVLPFAWTGVRLLAKGATSLRVRVTQAGRDSMAITAAAGAGSQLVYTVDGVLCRPVSAERLINASRGDLLEVGWQKTRLHGRVEFCERQEGSLTSSPHDVVVWCPEQAGGQVLTDMHSAISSALRTVQTWLRDPALANSKLAIVTTRAVCVAPHDTDLDVAYAPVWGLLRAAQAENPGRFQLIDTDGSDESGSAISGALALNEPEVALRAGEAFLPRLQQLASSNCENTRDLMRGGRILITGGTGGLGAQIARHMVGRYGARELLLVSRRGIDAPGARELQIDLRKDGVDVAIEQCDIVDKDKLASLIEQYSADSPIIGIVHAAAVVDNTTIDSMTPLQVERVLAAKADSAWYLHELTIEQPISLFVMFSSSAGLILGAGQANYAAANVFLDALAIHRHARGLPAVSLAWGFWSGAGMGDLLTEQLVQRVERQGVTAFSVADGLALFDRALAAEKAFVAPVRLNMTALELDEDQVPALLRGFVPLRRRTVIEEPLPSAALLTTLTGLPVYEQEHILAGMISRYAAILLGHDESSERFDAEANFLELGFDSLTTMDLRNRLAHATGLRLSPMVIFENQSPARLARWIRTELDPQRDGGNSRSDVGSTAYPASDPILKESLESPSELFKQAVAGGKLYEGLDLMRAIASLRPRFTDIKDYGGDLRAVRLAKGPRQPVIVCISTPVATGGPHQYARIAAAFRGERTVLALPLPGLVSGEKIPQNVSAAVDVLVQFTLSAAGDEPFVLLGYSAGGVLAYSVAQRLEQKRETRPAGVIMLDTFKPEGGGFGVPIDQLFAGFYTKEAAFGEFDSARLSGMVRWGHVLSEIDASQAISTPTLFVQCARPFFFDAASDGLRPKPIMAKPWYRDQLVEVVQSDHFSVLENDAGDAAVIIGHWVSNLR